MSRHRCAALAALLMLAFAGGPAVARDCAGAARWLPGAWRHAGPPQAFEQMEFALENGERVFNSWLHDRPDLLGGRWTLAGCALTVERGDGAGPAQAFVVEAADRRQLVLREHGARRPARFTRIAR